MTNKTSSFDTLFVGRWFYNIERVTQKNQYFPVSTDGDAVIVAQCIACQTDIPPISRRHSVNYEDPLRLIHSMSSVDDTNDKGNLIALIQSIKTKHS